MVFDEVHYVSDADRGVVWEEVHCVLIVDIVDKSLMIKPHVVPKSVKLTCVSRLVVSINLSSLSDIPCRKLYDFK